MLLLRWYDKTRGDIKTREPTPYSFKDIIIVVIASSNSCNIHDSDIVLGLLQVNIADLAKMILLLYITLNDFPLPQELSQKRQMLAEELDIKRYLDQNQLTDSFESSDSTVVVKKKQQKIEIEKQQKLAF